MIELSISNQYKIETVWWYIYWEPTQGTYPLPKYRLATNSWFIPISKLSISNQHMVLTNKLTIYWQWIGWCQWVNYLLATSTQLTQIGEVFICRQYMFDIDGQNTHWQLMWGWYWWAKNSSAGNTQQYQWAKYALVKNSKQLWWSLCLFAHMNWYTMLTNIYRCLLMLPKLQFLFIFFDAIGKHQPIMVTYAKSASADNILVLIIKLFFWQQRFQVTYANRIRWALYPAMLLYGFW